MILVLDDDGLVSTLLDQLIRDGGDACEISATVEDAYRRVLERGEVFALGLIDLRIGEDNRGGLRLAEMIRGIADPTKADLPLMLMTGGMDFVAFADLASGLRLSGLLSKPFSPDGLAQAIKRYRRFPAF
jgi:CheY-like chemotaxis protein